MGPADFVTISVEGVLGQAGRTNVTTTATMNVINGVFPGTVPPILLDAWNDQNISISWPQDLKKVSVTDREWNGLELLQATWNTYPFVLNEASNGAVVKYIPNIGLTVGFSDAANNSTNQVYDQIMLDSLSENYYTAAEMTWETSSTTDEFKVGFAPHVLYSGSTISPTQLGNQERAENIANVYSVASFDPIQVSCLSEAQSSWNLWMGANAWEIFGRATTVTFRGTTTDVFIIGMSITATPDTSRITYNLTPRRFFQYLRLDSATLGLLDQDRLGFY
jgi:hypothetical protein